GDTIVPANGRYYHTSVDETYHGNTFTVDIEGTLNVATGLLTVVFQAIDPKTQLPPDVLTGLLPPEDGTGIGKGYFDYTIQPRAGLPTGTAIRSVAFVSFDELTDIATNQVDDHDPTKGTDPNKEALVTIDSGAPISSVDPLPAVESSSSFTVT